MANPWDNDPITAPWELDPVVSPWDNDPIVTPQEQDDPIGLGEGIMLDAVQNVPGSLAGLEQSMELVAAGKRLQANDYAKPPTIGVAPSPAATLKDPFSFGYYGAISQISQRGFQAWTPKRQKEYDQRLIAEYSTEQEERSRRGFTLLGKAGHMSAQMPSIMVEWTATGGFRSTASEGTRLMMAKSLRRYATTSLGKAAIATSGAAAGVSLRAVGLPHRAVESVARRQVPRNMKINDDGSVEIEGPIEGMMESVVKGLADHWITIATEQSGEVFGPAFKKGFGFIGKKLPIIGKLLPRMQKAWVGSKPGRTLSAFNKQVSTLSGFNGTASELGEEWIDGNVKAILAIDHFGAGDNATWQQRVVAANKNFMDNAPAMALAFAPFGVARGISGLGSIPIQEQIKKREAAQTALDKLNRQAQGEERVPEWEMGADSAMFAEESEEAEFNLPPVLKETGAGKYFTPKWLVNRLIGAETMLEDVETALLGSKLEGMDLQKWSNSVVKKLKKEKNLTRLPAMLGQEAEKEGRVTLKNLFGGETELEQQSQQEEFLPKGAERKTKAHILQRKIDKNTNPVRTMYYLVDTYEDAPDWLTESEVEIFNDIRRVTRSLLDRVNKARVARGEAPIEGIEGYITHWMDAAVEDAIEDGQREPKGRIAGTMGKISKKLSKKIPNTTAERRKLHGELTERFSNDLGRSLKQMIKYDLRDIYITTPYQKALAELNELNRMGLVPDTTYKTIDDYLRYDIREMPTELDKLVNTSAKGTADLLKTLSLGKIVIDDPARQVFGVMRKLGYMSGLGFRVKSPLRNLGQRLLLQDLYRGRDYAKAQAVASRLAKMPQVEHPQTGKTVNLYDLIKEQNWYKMTIQRYEDLVDDADSVQTRFGDFTEAVEKVAFYAYSRSHAGNLFLSNVEVAALTGYFDWQNNYEQSKPGTEHFLKTKMYSMKHGIDQHQLLTHKDDMMWSIREAVRRTQWEYFASSMPTLYRGQTARAAFQFQSWGMNFAMNHTREMISQLTTGRNARGRLIPGAGRLRALKGTGTIVALGKVFEGAFDIAVLKFLLFPDLSNPLSAPIPNFILSVFAYWGADGDDEKRRAWAQLKRALKFWLPYSLAMKDMWELLSGEQDFSDVIFYKKK